MVPVPMWALKSTGRPGLQHVWKNGNSSPMLLSEVDPPEKTKPSPVNVKKLGSLVCRPNDPDVITIGSASAAGAETPNATRMNPITTSDDARCRMKTPLCAHQRSGDHGARRMPARVPGDG